VDLLVEVEQIKKDFFEEGLLKLVKAGDSSATIFGNRTLNRDRGYGEVTETRVSGVVGVASLPLDKLNLPVDVLRVVLNAVRDYETNKVPTRNVDTIKRIESIVK
jgi:hypothetical protein